MDTKPVANSVRGKNKCAFCGKMDAWENLEFSIEYDMDFGGNVNQSEWMEHKANTGCKKKSTPKS